MFQLKLLRCVSDTYHAQITVQNTIIINRTGQEMCNAETRLNMVRIMSCEFSEYVIDFFLFLILSEWSTLQINKLMFSLKL